MLTPKVEPRKWGYSLDLKLYDDPWKITKKLTMTDVGSLSRLLVPKNLAIDLVMHVFSPKAQRKTQTDEGTKIVCCGPE